MRGLPLSLGIVSAVILTGVVGCTGNAGPSSANRASTSGPPVAGAGPKNLSAAGLLAGYPLREGAGTTTADASGNGLMGTVVGAGWASGKNGWGLSFNGTSSYVDLGNPAVLQLTGSLTVSAWVYESGDVGDDGIIAAKSSGSGGWELKSSPDTGQRRYAIGVYTTGGGYVARYGNTVRALNTWNHVAGVYDATARTLHLYLNGVLDDGALWGTVPASISNPSVNVNLGRRQAGYHIKGVLDDVRVYGRVLTQAEIQADLLTPVDGVRDATPPTTPANLAATAVSATQVSLAWSASSDEVGVAGYKVYRDGAQIGVTTATSLLDSGVAPSSTHGYAVSAYDAASNESARSASVQTTTPALPFDFVVTGSGVASVARGGTTMVAIQAGLVSGVSEAISFTAAGLPSGVTASFLPVSCTPPCSTTATLTAAALATLGASTVSFTGTGGGLARSMPVALAVTSGSDLSPPTIVLTTPASGAIVAGTAVTITATASDDVGVAGVQFLLDGAPLNAEDTVAPYLVTWNTAAASGGAHVLSARARDAAGNVAQAAGIGVTVDNQPPTGTVVINGGASATRSTAATLTLSASDVSGAVTQMRFSNSGSSFSAAEAYATTKAWTLTSGAGTKTVYVRFKDGSGNWSASFTDTIVLDTTAPTVSGVAVSGVTGSTATIRWTTNEPATSQVEYGPTSSYGSRTPLDPVLVTSHWVVLSALAPRTTFSYRVRSLDAAGNERLGSRGTFTTPAASDTSPPSAPATLSATAASTSQIDLSWSASTDNVGVTGYVVSRGGAPVATVTGTAYSDPALASGTSFTYTVTARDAAGNSSAPSPAATATTFAPDTTPPSVPADLRATVVQAYSATLAWAPSTDDVAVTGYRVLRDGAWLTSVGGASFADAGLQPSTTYVYAVVALDAAGNASGASTSIAVTTAAGAPRVVFPLQVSANRRYLVDQVGAPFLIAGDSPQTLMESLSEAEAASFFLNRRTYGFNAMWINLVGGFVNGATYDGIPPFTALGDLSTPNPAYFARADAMLRLAASNDHVVILDPIETTAWLTVLRSNGVAKARAFGRYLGTRYQVFDNIIWMSGNDFQTWTDPTDDALVQAVALGIQDVDTRHIHTVELNVPVSGSLDDPSWASIIQLNASYTYLPTYAQVIADYNRANFIPTFLVEANYEFENNTGVEAGTPLVLRIQEYRAQLSGAAGQLYGNGYTWQFIDQWKTHLDTPGSAQFAYLVEFFASRRWYDLVPDQAHTVVTAGYGTFVDYGTNLGSTYVTTARTPDGALVVVYMPSRRTLTVNMASLRGTAAARWFDPATGTFVPIDGSPFSNAGSRSFTPPGNNGDGDGDWVLVLEAPAP